MDAEERIAQFRNMTEADPENEMAYFSLGNALLQAGQAADAAPCFTRCIEINPEMSKAYQMAGEAYLVGGDPDKATEVFLKGYEVAAGKGDLMPKNAISERLTLMGVPLPKVEEAVAPPVPEGSFICGVTGQPGTPMTKAPFRGPLGQKIMEKASQETWQLWVSQGTKVINELRLDLSREDHGKMYEEHMIEFLGLEEWAATALKES